MRQFINIVLVSSFILVSGVVAAAPPLDYDKVEAPRVDLITAHMEAAEQIKAEAKELPIKGIVEPEVHKTKATGTIPATLAWWGQVLDSERVMRFDNEEARNLAALGPASQTKIESKKDKKTGPNKVATARK